MDPEIHFECHRCHGPIAADLDMLDERVTCPHCQSITIAPKPPEKRRRIRPEVWPTLFISSLVLYAVAGFFINRLKDDSPQPSTAKDVIANATTAETLSMLETMDFSRPEPLLANRFESLLQQLDTKYNESAEEIAKLTLEARGLLRDKGINESMLAIMEGLNLIITTPKAGIPYSMTATFYVMNRDQGYTHDASLRMIKGVAAPLDME